LLQIWRRNDLDLRLKPYLALATGNYQGFLEIVTHSKTTAHITKVRWDTAKGRSEPLGVAEAHTCQRHTPTNTSARAYVVTWQHPIHELGVRS